MNSEMEKQFTILKMYQPMRAEVMATLEDADLDFRPENGPSIAELCVQMGEWEQSYINGFRHFKQEFAYRNDDPKLRKSVKALKSWYKDLDNDLEAAVRNLSDEDVADKAVERGGWQASFPWSLRIYQECLIIFYAKMWVYFNLLDRKQPEGLVRWIA